MPVTLHSISSVFLCSLLLLSPLPALAQPRNGQSVVLPTTERVERTYGFLETHPTATITAPGVLEVRYRTTTPTAPGQLYIGINSLDEELNYPRFRDSVRSESAALSQDHTLQIKFDSLLKKMANTPYEPRICWRVEVYLPEKNSSRFVEGRVYFNPQTLGPTPNILFGPTVEQLTETTALIAFELDSVQASTVQLTDSLGRALAPTNGMPNKKHEIRLRDLVPGQTYTYSINAGGTQTRSYSFTTPHRAKPFQFAAMVDSREGVGGGMQNFFGVNAFSLYTLGSDAYYRGADFIVFAGDLINGYTTSVADFEMQLNSFRLIMEPLHSRIPIYESMGNHEALIDTWKSESRGGISLDKQGEESAEAAFARAFVNPLNGPENEGSGTPTYKENVYFFDHGNARFFMLNNNYWWSSNPHQYGGNLEGYMLPTQIAWLREQVTLADADPAITHLFFAAQEPIFPNGGHTGDAMWYNGGDTNRDGAVDASDINIVENRNELWEIVSGSPKTAAFITGDEHAYSRTLIEPTTPVGHKRKPDGTEAVFLYPVMHVTSGGAGAPWYDVELDLPWTPSLKAHSTQPHYAFFKVDGGTVELEVYSQTGQRIDSVLIKQSDRPLVERRAGG
ncbi:MAG: metallophosphoesterase [Candidatus Sumerlaeia bacterium]|nr:metallophosphoesterase [Candidatus Sumerlaeia bacterium]